MGIQPKTDVDIAPMTPRRYSHVITAFLCGMICLPVLLYLVAVLMAGSDARFPITLAAWGVVVGSSVSGAIVVWPFIHMQLWMAAIAGSVVSVLAAIGFLAWLGA
jgi:hypothetical protein